MTNIVIQLRWNQWYDTHAAAWDLHISLYASQIFDSRWRYKYWL